MATGIIPKYADGNDSTWLTFSGHATKVQHTTYNPGEFLYRKIGNLVEIDSNGVKLAASQTGRTTIGVVPSGFRPDKPVYFNVAANGFGPAQVGIATTGTISFYPYANTWDTEHSIFIHVMYFCG